MIRQEGQSSRRVVRSSSPDFNSDNTRIDLDRSTTPTSDFEAFLPSDSTVEDFGGEDDKEWPVNAIVDETTLFNHVKKFAFSFVASGTALLTIYLF